MILSSRNGPGRFSRAASIRVRSGLSSDSSFSGVVWSLSACSASGRGCEQDVAAALEVGFALQSVDLGENLDIRTLAQHILDLVARPDVVGALPASRLGVERRVKASLRRGHRAGDERERGLGLVTPAGVASQLERHQVDRGKLGVVIEHLLEVRNDPVATGRIAVITPAELIANAPRAILSSVNSTMKSGSARPGLTALADAAAGEPALSW